MQADLQGICIQSEFRGGWLWWW